MRLAIALFACMLAASAAEIDGRWTAETTARGKKAVAAQNNSFNIELATTPEGKVTGNVSLAGKKKPRLQSIQNAKLDGNRLSFTTQQTTKKASVKFSWEVIVDGAQMTGTRTREGAKRGVPFKAKKMA